MSFNLLKLLESQMNEGLIGLASKFIGESETNTKSALELILPGVIGGVINKGSDERGASSILDLINTGNHDGGVFDNLKSVFGDKESLNGLVEAGKLILPAILGRKEDSFMDSILSLTGLNKSSGSSLTRLIAPLIISMIGKRVKEHGLNAKGLMNLLLGQKEHVASRIPVGMGSLLGIARPEPSPEDNKSANQNNWWKWLLLVLAVLLALFLIRDCKGKSGGTAADYIEEVAENAGDNFKSALGYTVDAAGNLVDSAGNIIKKAGEFTIDKLGNIVDAAGNVIDKTWAAMSRGFMSLNGYTVDEMGNLVDETGNIIKKAGEFTVDSAGNILDASGNVLDRFGAAIGDGFKTVKGWTIDAAGNLVDGAGKIIKKAGEFTVDAAGNVLDATGNVLDKVGSAIGNVFRSVKGWTIDAAGNLVDGAGNIIKKAGEFTIDAAGNIIDASGKVLDKVATAGKNAITYLVNEAGDLVDNEGNVIAKKGTFTANANGTYSDNNGKLLLLPNVRVSADSDMMANEIKLIVDDSGNLVNEAGEIVYKAGEYKVENGYYVDVEGNRIGRVWDKIKEAISDVADKTVEGFKTFFGNMMKTPDAPRRNYTLTNIEFNPENQRITDYSKAEVEGLAEALKAYPNSKISVNSYTNDGKSNAENKNLSSMRAEVVKAMLGDIRRKRRTSICKWIGQYRSCKSKWGIKWK